MVEEARFNAAEFLRELSLMRDNKKRCDFVAEQVNSLVEVYGLAGLVDVNTEKLNSPMVKRGLYNLEVAVPDLRRPARDGSGIEELIMSCHTDAIQMSLANPVGPGVNDNGSGVAVLLHDLENNLDHLSGRMRNNNNNRLDLGDIPKTRYMFFTGEEGSLKGVGLSSAALALAYAFPGMVIGPLLLPGLGAIVSIAYSLVLMESMSRSPMFNPGLCGSYSWAMALEKEDIAKPKMLVNFDMVGQYAPSVEGGFGGLANEIKKSMRWKRNAEDDEAGEYSGKTRSVVVPSSNISTNPASWIFPVRHDGLSPYLREIIYTMSVETGMPYNVRTFLSLGSSDHASVQQVSDKRKGRLESAMMIGLGGMDAKHEIHTKKDSQVNKEDLEFSCLVAERLAKTPLTGWKNYFQVRHLDEMAYAGLYGNGIDRIVVARCYDKERDQWVNLYFQKVKVNEAIKEGADRKDLSDGVISLLPTELIDWNLESELVKRGMLKGHEGYQEISPDLGTVFDYIGRRYAVAEDAATKRRWSEAKADVAGFLAERQVIPLLAMMTPISGAIMGGGVALAAAIPVPPVQAGVLIGAVAASVIASYKMMMIPLRYSNVIAETMYDIEAERGNSQLRKAVLI